ncbi:PQQ-binding-like beta-propeller repeat protein [Bradyrhizobium sp. AS23.2]|uniref:PQQ-binding-like beta-propeller repeat protein n=1 Tax=Bradyrhizobium sp. AS23.2 TaxID=1680155 RepID=UPI00093F5161|nr:PQQ-binding-like beta-propeller repeat protein [Bradyrhizobium sp. AS23.2]OKO82955.1 hypothetical protein AC630_12475 [Bradyrhizobium sp. AS23.2]
MYAQPLIVPDITISGAGVPPGPHDVVYVVTENNSIYAIDANNGEILLFRNLGQAVPAPPNSAEMHACRNNGPRIGIESTPVIDLAQGTMYLMSYTMGDVQPAYRLHAIDLATLNDRVAPVVVSASHKLDDGSTFVFDAAKHRQRAALLLAHGNIYAAFSSWCDRTSASRGWLLGWGAADLKPLEANFLPDRSPTLPALSTIWMSGYGIAAVAGHLYFATGNSRKNTYDSNNNLSESVVKVSADLRQVLDFFTPSNVNQLDTNDVDLGSGGVLLLPDQLGNVRHMAAAAGKDGQMFLIDRNNMGGFNTAANHVLDTKQIGACWCGQSYYLNNIVSSGGTRVGVWQVITWPSPSLTQIHSSTDLPLGGDSPGFFTSISSNGEADVIIWAVSRSNSSPPGGPEPTLFAFQPIPGTFELKLLFQSVAGNWDVPLQANWNEGANSNIVPVVANGQVYVASYKELDIFGFVPPVAEARTTEIIQNASGQIIAVSGSQFTLKTGTGTEVRVEAELAIKNGLSPELVVGQGVNVSGNVDAQGLLHADVIKPARTAKKP